MFNYIKYTIPAVSGVLIDSPFINSLQFEQKTNRIILCLSIHYLNAFYILQFAFIEWSTCYDVTYYSLLSHKHHLVSSIQIKRKR